MVWLCNQLDVIRYFSVSCLHLDNFTDDKIEQYFAYMDTVPFEIDISQTITNVWLIIKFLFYEKKTIVFY